MPSTHRRESAPPYTPTSRLSLEAMWSSCGTKILQACVVMPKILREMHSATICLASLRLIDCPLAFYAKSLLQQKPSCSAVGGVAADLCSWNDIGGMVPLYPAFTSTSINAVLYCHTQVKLGLTRPLLKKAYHTFCSGKELQDSCAEVAMQVLCAFCCLATATSSTLSSIACYACKQSR